MDQLFSILPLKSFQYSPWLMTAHSATIWNYNGSEQRDLQSLPEIPTSQSCSTQMNKMWCLTMHPPLHHRTVATSPSPLWARRPLLARCTDLWKPARSWKVWLARPNDMWASSLSSITPKRSALPCLESLSRPLGIGGEAARRPGLSGFAGGGTRRRPEHSWSSWEKPSDP